tara:strand:+ start:44 stop:322 length:279 start_codon:yes stop_codon:yes gene_type:complete
MTEYIKKKKKPTGLPSLGKVGRALKKDRIEGVTEPFKGYQIKDSEVVIMAPKKDKKKLLNTNEYSKGGRAKLRGGGMSQRGLGKAFKKGGRA